MREVLNTAAIAAALITGAIFGSRIHPDAGASWYTRYECSVTDHERDRYRLATHNPTEERSQWN